MIKVSSYCFAIILCVSIDGLATPIIEQPRDGVARESLESFRDVVQSGVKKLADSIDRFFGSQRYTEEEQKSTLRTRSTLTWGKSGEMDFKLSVRGKLNLPRVEDRWQIFISRLSDEGEDQVTDERDIIIDRQKDEDDTIVGLQYIFYSKVLRHFKLRVGPRIREGKIKAYVAARARHSREFYNWLFQFTQTIYFDNDDFGERSNFDFEKRLGKKTLFSWDHSITFSESSKGLDLGSIVSIRHLNSPGLATGVSVGAAAYTRPNTAIDTYYFAIHLRKRLGRDWLHLDLRPEARFPREFDYDFFPILYTTLEMTF